MKKLDKRVKWVLITGLIITLLIPPGVMIGIYLINPQNVENDGLIDFSRDIPFTPTPNSDINIHYSILENQTSEQFLYHFNFTFDIVKGIESSYADDVYGWIFNQTQLYLSIKGTYELEFYAVFFILNTSEFQVDGAKISITRELEISQRLENLSIKLRVCRTTNGEEGTVHFLGGSINLFEKETEVTVDDFSSFLGSIRIWIDENYYTFNYTIFQNSTLQYTLNSSIGSLELYFADIRVRTFHADHHTETEHIEIPYYPLQTPGNHSDSAMVVLSGDYIALEFEINVAIEWMGSYIVYDFELLSEIIAKQATEEKARRDELLRSLLTYSLFVMLGIGVVLGCMVNAKRT